MMPKWIDVKERLPTQEEKLVWIFDPDITGGVMGPYPWHEVDPNDGDTHWMPTNLEIPEPPQ